MSAGLKIRPLHAPLVLKLRMAQPLVFITERGEGAGGLST